MRLARASVRELEARGNASRKTRKLILTPMSEIRTAMPIEIRGAVVFLLSAKQSSPSIFLPDPALRGLAHMLRSSPLSLALLGAPIGTIFTSPLLVVYSVQTLA